MLPLPIIDPYFRHVPPESVGKGRTAQWLRLSLWCIRLQAYARETAWWKEALLLSESSHLILPSQSKYTIQYAWIHNFFSIWSHYVILLNVWMNCINLQSNINLIYPIVPNEPLQSWESFLRSPSCGVRTLARPDHSKWWPLWNMAPLPRPSSPFPT